jgi:hypothetical protein
MESLQIYINSKFADNIYNNNNSDITLYIPQIESDTQNHIYLSVQNAVIPCTYYNINNTNNVLVWTYDNNLIHTSIIEPGNYNINIFIQMLTTAMVYNTINNNVVTSHYDFTITYNSNTNKLTFQQKTNQNFTFLSTSSMFSLIGFFENYNYVSHNGKLKSVKAVNLSPIQMMLIECNYTTNSIMKNHDENNRSVLCSIPIDTQQNGILVYNNINNYKINTFRNTMSELNIKILDQDGHILNLNNVEWSMTLQIDIINFVED